MRHHLRPSTPMQNRKQRSTIPTLMFDVLKPSREIGDTATADAQTAPGSATIREVSISYRYRIVLVRITNIDTLSIPYRFSARI